MEDTKARPLSEIAADILETWKPRVSPYAVPYLEAMSRLNSVDDVYGPASEDASDIVQRFLINASTWRGEDARRIKAELKGMVK